MYTWDSFSRETLNVHNKFDGWKVSSEWRIYSWAVNRSVKISIECGLHGKYYVNLKEFMIRSIECSASWERIRLEIKVNIFFSSFGQRGNDNLISFTDNVSSFLRRICILWNYLFPHCENVVMNTMSLKSLFASHVDCSSFCENGTPATILETIIIECS